MRIDNPLDLFNRLSPDQMHNIGAVLAWILVGCMAGLLFIIATLSFQELFRR